jgi:putative Holliday junction resolvase
MSRILCIDYGGKRCGLAVTDPLQLIATALTTVDTKEVFDFLKKYVVNENVSLILIGYPLDLNDKATHATPLVEAAIKRLQVAFPNIPIQKVDERFTSKMASMAMVNMGMKKKDRQQKSNIDKIAATIMLQDYLAYR